MKGRDIKIQLSEKPSEEALAAFSHLTNWAWDSYPIVHIYEDHMTTQETPNGRRQGYIAVYREEEGSTIAYVIGAVWSEQHQRYCFHS